MTLYTFSDGSQGSFCSCLRWGSHWCSAYNSLIPSTAFHWAPRVFSISSFPPPPNLLPPAYTSEQCLTLWQNGPKILTHHSSHTSPTLRRRTILPELSSAQSYMVRLLIHLPIFVYLVLRSIILGVVVVLFFRCMGALLHPAHCVREGVRWGLVAYTVAVFSFVTIFTATILDMKSICYIDNRGFTGTDTLPPGPLGYDYLVSSKTVFLVPGIMFLLNNWLADGVLVSSALDSVTWVPYVSCASPALSLLCYLCHELLDHRLPMPDVPRLSWCVLESSQVMVRVSANAGAAAAGIMFLYYQTSQPTYQSPVASSFRYPYFAISLGLNITLTLMIVIRLVLRSRNIRNAMGAPAITTGLCKAALTVLVESSALYALSFLLFIVPWAAGSTVSVIFLPILANVQVRVFCPTRHNTGSPLSNHGSEQVIAPFLIILRIADRSAVASDATASGSSGTNQFTSRGESVGSNEIPPDVSPTGSVAASGKRPGEPGI